MAILLARARPLSGKPSDKEPRRPIIALSKARGFVLKGPGITLDGTIDSKSRLNNLVTILSDCPGLTLEDLDFQSFSQAGVVTMNCQAMRRKLASLA